MKLPKELVLLRHGESEGNVASGASYKGDHSLYTPTFRITSSLRWKLTKRGRAQAQKAREWMHTHNLTQFDVNIHSDMQRAIETAHIVGGQQTSFFETHLVRERSWGILNTLPHNEKGFGDHKTAFEQRYSDLFHYCPPGGEHMGHVVERARMLINYLPLFSPQHDTVRIVCHGEMMWGFRILLEKLSGDDFNRMQHMRIPENIMHNCQLLHYRGCTETGGYAERYSVCTYDPNLYDSGWLDIQQ